MIPTEPPFEECIDIRQTRQRAGRLAISDLPLIIEGEPGTGRRTLANSVAQQRTTQSGGPLMILDAFEGVPVSFRDRFSSGKTQQTELLVHSLDSLSVRQQAELASCVHDKQVRMVAVVTLREGSEASAANEEFRALVSTLEIELGATRIRLAPLRDRQDDVIRWAEFFLQRAAERLAVEVPLLGSDALNALRQYRWPGNLIELDAALNRALCLSAAPELSAVELGLSEDRLVIQPLAEAIEHFRRSYVEQALAHFSGNRTQTARALGVDVRTIFRYLEREKGT